ncbi:MAG: hypothetical protein FJ291_10980 [Planctomycetes bacterium]|nr:hypothetical protein [Planctomycetota bacterium]
MSDFGFQPNGANLRRSHRPSPRRGRQPIATGVSPWDAALPPIQPPQGAAEALPRVTPRRPRCGWWRRRRARAGPRRRRRRSP